MKATNVDSRYSGTKSTKAELYDVLVALKGNIFRTLNVATFAEVQSINNDIVKVQPFPLTEDEASKVIDCFTCQVPVWDNKASAAKFVNLSTLLSRGDIVAVCFTDRNSIQNLKQVKNGIDRSVLLENTDLHSDNYGFIINVMWKKDA